jgi:hypothetical protein
MKINIFEYIVMRKMIFSSEKPPKINKIKKHDVPDLHTIQNKPKSWNHAPKKSSQIQLGIPSNFEKFTRFKT